jgi:hypothetical protein
MKSVKVEKKIVWLRSMLQNVTAKKTLNHVWENGPDYFTNCTNWDTILQHWCFACL